MALEREIYDLLTSAGLSKAGALAVMGNMQAESGLKADNVQNSSGMTDDYYTSVVKSGVYDFVHDSIGYGLCQWTYYSRKAALLDFCGVKLIDNYYQQTKFVIWELKNHYYKLFKKLQKDGNAEKLAIEIMKTYENPADQGTKEQARRKASTRQVAEKLGALNDRYKLKAKVMIYKTADFNQFPSDYIDDRGVYTITQYATAHGVKMGKLKSGAGWIVIADDLGGKL